MSDRKSITLDQAEDEIYALSDLIQKAINDFNEKTGLYVQSVSLIENDLVSLDKRPKKLLCGVSLEVTI